MIKKTKARHFMCKFSIWCLIIIIHDKTVEFTVVHKKIMFILFFTVNLHSCNKAQAGWGSEGPHTNISALDSSCLKICSRVPIAWDNQGEFVCTAHVGRSTCSDLSLPQGLSLGSQEQGLAQELIQFPSFVAHVYVFLAFIFFLMSQISSQCSGIPLGELFLV